MLRKTLALILAAAMLIGMFPASGSGAECEHANLSITWSWLDPDNLTIDIVSNSEHSFTGA